MYAEYDLIRGLTELGVTLRCIGDFDLLREVLAYLVRLTEPAFAAAAPLGFRVPNNCNVLFYG